jgi:hypothetical protein
LSPHRRSVAIDASPKERDDFFPSSSTESSDDDLESVEDNDSDGSTLVAPDPGLTKLVVGVDLSGLDNETGCCHLNCVIVVLVSCRMFRRLFGRHDHSPVVEEEVWRNLIDLRCQMGTLITQSTFELQFILSLAPEFSGYFERLQDAYDTFERMIHLLSQTEYGADLVALMALTT